MATQKCPKCKSDRVRLGYRPTSTFLKLIFRYNLLCDACNWEFTGFAIPGTVPKKTKKKRTNENDNQKNVNLTGNTLKLIENPNDSFEKFSESKSEIIETDNTQFKKTKVKKKVKVKLF